MDTIEQIKMRYPHERTQDIADDLNLTYGQVTYRAYQLGLKKSEEFKKSKNSGRYSFIENGKAFRFPKGHEPHNKGVKMPKKIYERVKPSMFKKGHRPHNWKPDGSIVKRKDKTGPEYLYYKIKDSHWILYHQKVWMDHNGPIDDGYIVCFKDGNTLNCNIDNLEMISRQENARRNSIHQYPKDIQELVKLKNKLNKKINNHGKK